MYTYEFKDTLIDIKDLNISYGNQVILKDINLSIKDIIRPNNVQGQIVAILGPSGIGKTQLFRCIAGLQQPTSGQVTIHNKPVQSGDVGLVFQHYPLFMHLNVRQNLLLSCNDDKQVNDMLTQFNLTSLHDKYPTQLSGGQRQRVSIIQQILRNNYFLLMDEPFSGLDVVSKQRMMDLIRSISTLHEHNTIIFTTHDIECAVELADQIIMIGHKPKTIGASVIQEINLIDKGIAWRDVSQNIELIQQTISNIKQTFMAI